MFRTTERPPERVCKKKGRRGAPDLLPKTRIEKCVQSASDDQPVVKGGDFNKLLSQGQGIARGGVGNNVYALGGREMEDTQGDQQVQPTGSNKQSQTVSGQELGVEGVSWATEIT